LMELVVEIIRLAVGVIVSCNWSRNRHVIEYAWGSDDLDVGVFGLNCGFEGRETVVYV